MTDLAHHIRSTTMIDTHEHLAREPAHLECADILRDLFDNYASAELVVAGAPGGAVTRLLDVKDPDIAGRFGGVQAAWGHVRHTGFGEGVGLIARELYGLDELTPQAIEAAAGKAAALHGPGERLRILRDLANLDHVQVDDFCWACLPDESGPEFFLYDLSWAGFASGIFDDNTVESLRKETGIGVTNTATLREAMAGLFTRHAPCAIAVKTQHAYNRTLLWRPREDADAQRVLDLALAHKALTEEDRLCLGDWCLARGVELAIEHDLPVKIHTGYYAGQGYMRTSRIAPGHLCELLIAYPKARFVLMHTGYPYGEELIALAKHFHNVYADLCWAWSIDPRATVDFVRRFIHAVPANKLFAFGGDIFWPAASLAYSIQCRRWLTQALGAEVAQGELSERDAIALATMWMQDNQRACFDIEGKRRAIRAAMQAQASADAGAANPRATPTAARGER